MATHGVWQLKKLTVRYCQHGGSSSHIRDFLKGPEFLSFASANPQIEFHTTLKSAKHPILIGDYINDVQKVIDIKNQEPSKIMTFIERLRNSSGRKMTKLKKPVVSERPSSQGLWEEHLTSDFVIQHHY